MDKLAVLILRFYVWEIKFPFNKIRFNIFNVWLKECWTTGIVYWADVR